jgi:CubicO group peptidase (beta-lactamase class C family)
MKKSISFLIMIFMISSTIAQNQKPDPRLKGIDQQLEEVLADWKASGFAVAVVEKNKIVYAKGFGYRDYDKKLPADANTLFAIGSSTKAFTSSVLGLLRKEGKLGFEDSPRKYISELKFFNSELDNMVTIQDMMCHRTGIPRHDLSWYLFPTASKDTLIQRMAHQEPFTDLRKQWYYNNFMFLTQGVIAEKITGKSWEENIADLFFKPLGMNRSNASIAEMKKSKNAALGYELTDDDEIKKLDYYDIAGMSPAGSINSSVNEMSNWLITWINNGKFEEKEILPENYVSEAISSHMVVGGGAPGKEYPDLHIANYGYGWFLSSYRGHYRVEHGGNIDGFSANACFYPSDSIGIIVLTNQDGSTIPSVVRNIMADRMLGIIPIDWNKDLKERREKAIKEQKEVEAKSISSQVKGTKPSHILQEFVGTYSHPGYGSFELSVERDSLFGQFKIEKIWLQHYHYDIFKPFEVEETGIDTTDAAVGLLLNFITNDVGEISAVSMKVEPTLDPIKFKRKPSIIELDKEILDQYIGEYELAGTIIKVYLKNENTLCLLVPGQPEYELLPTATHKFSLKILDGYKVEFVESDQGGISDVLFIQPNGTFKATKK